MNSSLRVSANAYVCYDWGMFGKGVGKQWVIGALLVAVAATVAFGFVFGKKAVAPSPSGRLTGSSLDACAYLTVAEAESILGKELSRKPVNTDTSYKKDVRSATCEYNQGLSDGIVIHITKALTDEAKAAEHAVAAQPVAMTSEEPYAFLGRDGFIIREHTNDEGYVLASGRFPTRDGTVQVNARMFAVVEQVLAVVLPRLDEEM